MPDADTIAAKLKPLLKGRTKFALLFGSAAKGRLHAESDIDLAVYLDPPIEGFEKRAEFAEQLERAVGREIDLIVLNDADPIISMQAIQEGIPINDEAPGFLSLYKAQKTSEYIDFKRNREIIEQSLMKKGWPKWPKKDVLLAKISIVRNCLAMIRKATGLDPAALDDQMKQDVFILNLERSVQACIDMANTIIAQRGLMIPASYKQAFQILAKEKVITAETAGKMQKMAGFRNIAVHDYRQLDVAILKSILARHLPDLEDFCREIYPASGDGR